MASIYSSKSTYGWQLRLDYTVSQDVAGNKSTIAIDLYIYNGTGFSKNVAANSCYYTIYDSTKIYNPYEYTDSQKNTWIKLGSKSVAVTHDADGTKTVTLSGYWASGFTSQYTPESLSASGSVALPTIPRASTLKIADGTLGTAQTLTISRASSSFTHTLSYACGTASGTIGSAKTTATSVSWTPPVALAAQNTTSQSVSVAVTLITYNGSTEIGRKAYTVNMTVPASVKPTVSITTSNPEGHLNKYGGYVQGKSTCKIVLAVTKGQGSDIKSYSIKVGTSLAYSTNGVTTGVLQESGDAVKITVTVTDSRGRSGTKEATIKVLPYHVPKVTGISAYRCEEDGTADACGAYANTQFTGEISPLGNKNSASYKACRRVRGTSAWTDLGSYNGYNTSASIINNAELDTSYEYSVVATDDFGSVRSTIVSMASGTVLIATTPDMDGLSVGQMETKSGVFGVGWDLELKGYTIKQLADHVVAQGADGMWTYRKWHSGIAECWGKVENLSTSGGAVQMNWPQTNGLFTVIDAVEATAWYGADASTRTARSLFITVSTNTEHCTLYLRRGDGSLPPDGTNFAVSIKAIGRWK